MEALKQLIHDVKQIDGTVLLFGGLGLILMILGGMLLNMNTPNLQVGYPTTAIGFAFFVFSTSINNSINSAKKTDQILEKLNNLQEEMKKNKEL